MNNTQLPFEVSPAALLPGPLKTLARPLEPALLKLLIPKELIRAYSASRHDGQTAAEFVAGMLHGLNIDYEIPASDVSHLPASGASLVVANHPFGMLEGLVLIDLLEKVRSDYRIVANSLLATTPALREKVLFVNILDESPENMRSVRASLEWLRKGGMLVMFPAGAVSHLNWGELPVADPAWNSSCARLARRVGCSTLPLFFDGANSLRFQMAGAIHPSLRTLNLAHELVNKRKHPIRVRVGNAIPAGVLRNFPDAESATQYLRARTYLLSSRTKNGQQVMRRAQPVAATTPPDRMTEEIARLGAERVLASNAEFKVVLASAQEIPNVLQEIGVAREATYREIGEGTGQAADLDKFDQYYWHLVLWHNNDKRVAGAYRLAATADVLRERGVKGLYTSTLFRYQPGFFERIGPAIELGRSFVTREYQKQYAPLLLLWKGIAAYVQQRPECAVIFGAVSISAGYQSLSRTLMVEYLKGHLAQDLAAYIQPRHHFRSKRLVPKHIKQLRHLLHSLDELSSSVEDLERDGKGLPVLIRQYMRMGGQFLGFNVDRRFSNAIDALAIVDLRSTSGPALERLMGRDGARAFRAWHQIDV